LTVEKGMDDLFLGLDKSSHSQPPQKNNPLGGKTAERLCSLLGGSNLLKL
jgi:hypothetical protein